MNYRTSGAVARPVWKYTWISNYEIEALAAHIDEAGEEGWELVSVCQAMVPGRYTAFLKMLGEGESLPCMSKAGGEK